MDADMLARARRVLDALAMPEGVSPASRHVREMAGTVAMPALIALAEACTRRAEAEGAVRWAEQALDPMGYEDPQIDAAIRRRDLAVARAALVAPEADEAIDAALAELAALDGGEVAE